jgi:hypothetical protein
MTSPTIQNVYNYSGQWVQQTARALLLSLITLLLLMPVIICNSVTKNLLRIIIVVISTITFLLVVLWLTKSRTIELILTGATYVTVPFQSFRQRSDS